MDKSVYVSCLLERLSTMIQENAKSAKRYKELVSNRGETIYWDYLNKLNSVDRELFLKEGVIYSKSDLQRVRIELNKVLIEMEKGK